jgi:hypothetical protein
MTLSVYRGPWTNWGSSERPHLLPVNWTSSRTVGECYQCGAPNGAEAQFALPDEQWVMFPFVGPQRLCPSCAAAAVGSPSA